MSASDIKSTAVVKYTAVEMPAQFRQLQRDTDLKQPPANWLQGNSKLENNLRNLTFGKGHFFSSFSIGHCYPELTGEIDVVSDAENIKKLLKMPYSQAPVSMMVHRVANTLLLDDFDIHKHLLRQQQKDWQWLRKFYYETVLQNMRGSIKDKMHVIKKNKSRGHLQNMNMFSKFLYYSVGQSEEAVPDKPQACCSTPQGAALSSPYDNIPDPLPQSEDPRPEQQRAFQWTFEDIRMLIGTDLPIFGGHTHPCISLRLRDQRNPINVLTGLDYWLDNLMCNVPEMAMCYHLDGIVQSYEVIKTDDIPTMSDAEFSPGVVKDIAQNILSFLKSNATKEGHTYWLFKGHNDEVIKLYDLTTLCAGSTGDMNHNNPFTVPVGMLLYRVARNMRQNQGRHKSGTVRTLLKKCLLLLDQGSHPQVVTSALLLLSDLYVSDNIFSLELTPDTSDDSDIEDEQVPEDSPDEVTPPITSTMVQSLCVPETVCQPDKSKQEMISYPPVSGDVKQRCNEALKHIANGLSCLDTSITNNENSENPEQTRCHPEVPIPLHYQPIKTHQQMSVRQKSPETDKSNSTNHKMNSKSHDTGSTNQVTVFTSGLLPKGSWHKRSKLLLIRKAAIAYYGLAEWMLTEQDRSQAWSYITTALTCFRALEVIDPDMADDNRSLLSVILSLCGDVHLQLARHRESNEPPGGNVADQSEDDLSIQESIRRETQERGYEWLYPVSREVQDNLERSAKSYKLALEEADKVSEIFDTERLTATTKRYGNILNELGVHYMNVSVSLMADYPDKHNDTKRAQEFWEMSLDCFISGIKQFRKLNDSLNHALLSSNLGRLYRLCAQSIVQDLDTGQRKREFSPLEAQYFTKAQDRYKEALKMLSSRSSHPEIWDSVCWELSTTYFTMATKLQDYAPLSTKAQEQIEREVISLMEKALDLCSADNDSVRHTACVYRAATIHHRMASLHHNAYRNQMDDKKLRYLRTESEKNYNTAANLFIQSDSPCELLRVQLERVALYEYQLQNQTSVLSRSRSLHSALDTLRSCRVALDSLAQQVAAQDEALTQQELKGLREEGEKLVGIFVSRLQFVALNLVKNSSAKGKKSSHTGQNSTYKTIYSLILKGTVADSTTDLVTRCQHLVQTLLSLDSLCSDDSHQTSDTPPGKGTSTVLKKR